MITFLSLFVIVSASAVDLNNVDEIITDDLAIEEGTVFEISDDEEDILSDEPKTYELDGEVNTTVDIQDAIDLANPGDTIKLKGTFKFDDDNSNTIQISKSINILGVGDGANITTDYNEMGYFKITASNVFLSNLKFIGSSKSAINWQGDNGIISHCEFKNNYANNAGALLLAGNNCNVTNCAFTGNNAVSYGGAIVANGQNNRIINSTFRYNYVEYADSISIYGGAIYSNCPSLIIDNCKFIGNFVKNKGNGGAVFINASRNNISKCDFNENYVSDSTEGGGAIYSNSQYLTITGCTFNKNQAKNGNGGAIYLGGFGTVSNSNFEDNSAKNGNSIYVKDVEYSKVKSNTFVVETNDVIKNAVYGFSVSELKNNNNVFTVLKTDSKIIFDASMIFEYGSSGKIQVKVEGGKIVQKNIKVLGHPEAKITYSKNVITVSNLPVGKYTLQVTTTPDDDHLAVKKTLSIKVNKATAVIKASKITVALKKGTYWSIKIVDSKSGKGISNMKITLKVYTGKKYKKMSLKTNSKGVASYQTKSLSKGKHKVKISATHSGYNFNALTSYIKVIKPTSLKFDVNRKTYRDGATLSIMVKNKKTKKALNGVKVKLLIYTGSKLTKTVILKTLTHENKKGVVGYATNELTVGKHKVKIVPYHIKYSGSAKSYLKILKSAKKEDGVTTKISAKV